MGRLLPVNGAVLISLYEVAARDALAWYCHDPARREGDGAGADVGVSECHAPLHRTRPGVSGAAGLLDPDLLADPQGLGGL